MKKMLSVAIATALMAACGESRDSEDAGTGGGTPPASVTDASIVVGDITSTSFDSGNGTLVVQIPLDGGDVLQQYVAAGSLNGYTKFTLQDDPLDRAFAAFAAESADGSVQAVVAMDGGQFNRFFGGATITQNSYTAPTSGLVSYAGAYVGLTNVGPGLPIPLGADPSLTPGSTSDITGTVFLNADFAGNNVNGAIYDRVLDFDGVDVDLQTVILTATDIAADGSFNGSVEFEDLSSVGSYDGAFGGTNAANVAGIVSLGDGFLEGALINGTETAIFDEVIGEAEIGIFVIGQCPTGGADCFGTE